MWSVFEHFLFYWVLPCSIALGGFFIFKATTKQSYEHWDVDKIWKSFIKLGITIGIIVIIFVLISNAVWFKNLLANAKVGVDNLKNNQVAQQAIQHEHIFRSIVITFLAHWIPVYFRAFLIVWFLSFIVMIQSLVWRVDFTRGANIIAQTFLFFPFLTFKYLLGYQTPFFDFVQAKLYQAKIKENLNDSYFDALSGVDEKGEKFKDGVGGSVQTQRIKATALAIRRTKAYIKTAGGIRHAELVTKKSRETDTDKLIERVLSGLGARLSASNIRFQDDPIFTPDRDKGSYIFDSDVDFNAGDELGSWFGIFFNPLSSENRVSNGGRGFFKAYGSILNETFQYIIHLTPRAIYERMISTSNTKYAKDESIKRAKYIVQHNLDLSVVPVPFDPKTNASIAELTEQAKKVANARIEDVTNALNAYKLTGTFKRVLVGGNTASYEYTLPRSANLPTDFDRVQKGIGNMLKAEDTPQMTVNAGILRFTMVNGVNIPIDFAKSMRERKRGISEIISGIAGVDAMGKNIEFNLGDTTPHAILYGKTGTGKTVSIMDIVYSMMDAVDPSMLRIAYIDGKGNSFEFMRNDNPDSATYHPNPFTYAQPADASGDIDYARALVNHLVRETRRRIDIFKKAGVSKLSEYNRKNPDKKMFEILAVIDEFSAIIDQDDQLKVSELAEKGITDRIEYLAKMARSVGIRMLLANQTARKEKVPGKISGNIGGRLSLGVSEPIESDMALPDSGISLDKINEKGEFYTTMNSRSNPQHGNSPYLPDDVMFALNDSLEKKFGHNDYVISREEIIAEMDSSSGLETESSSLLYSVPKPMPTPNTCLEELIGDIKKYPEWALANKESQIFTKNKALHTGTPKVQNQSSDSLFKAFEEAKQKKQAIDEARNAQSRKHSGQVVAGITRGSEKGTL